MSNKDLDDLELLAELAEFPEDVVNEKRSRRRGGRDSLGHISRLARAVVAVAQKHGVQAVLGKAQALAARVGQMVSAVTQPVRAASVAARPAARNSAPPPSIRPH